MKKRVVVAAIGIVLFVGGISGCGKAGKDEIAESLSELQDNSASGMDANVSATDVEIPEHISYSIPCINGTKIEVDADVISAGYEKACVYEVEEIELDDNLLEEYAEKLFDEGNYKVIKPYSISSIQELQEERALLQEQIDSYESDKLVPVWIDYTAAKIDKCIEEYDESEVSELAEGQFIYDEEAEYTNLFDENENITYSTCRLRGYVDEEIWELFYERINGSENRQCIKIYPYESEVANAEYMVATMNEMSESLYNKNRSNLEESEKVAVDMLNQLGYLDMEAVNIGHLVQRDDNLYMDGYKFTFAKSISGMQIGYKKDSVSLSNTAEFSVQQEYIHVYVRSNKVYMVVIDNVIEVGNNLSEGPVDNLLSFEKIDEIAKEYFSAVGEAAEDVNAGNFKVSSVELKYSLVPFEGGKVSLMPTWIFYQHMDAGYGDYRVSCLTLNAVDGSMVMSYPPNFTILNDLYN